MTPLKLLHILHVVYILLQAAEGALPFGVSDQLDSMAKEEACIPVVVEILS